MLKRLQLNQFEDFWAPLAARPEPGAYFWRVAGYSPALEKFLQQALEKRAACGDRYREALCARIRKLSAVAQPELGAGLTAAIVKGLSIGELEEMAQALQRMADAKMPVTPQLAGRSLEKTERAADDRAFYI